MTESAMCLYYILLLHSLFACSGSKYKIHFTQILLYSTKHNHLMLFIGFVEVNIINCVTLF